MENQDAGSLVKHGVQCFSRIRVDDAVHGDGYTCSKDETTYPVFQRQTGQIFGPLPRGPLMKDLPKGENGPVIFNKRRTADGLCPTDATLVR